MKGPSPRQQRQIAARSIEFLALGQQYVVYGIHPDTQEPYRWPVEDLSDVPLSELPKGMRDVAVHNRLGHPAYLLGVTRVYGVWYFFPVVLALKTPIAALVLGMFGFAVLVRRGLANR